MKKISIFFGFCLFFIGVESGFCQTAEMLKFGIWNIRWQSGNDKQEGNAWEKRIEPISNVIHFYDFDILGIQEGSEGKLKDLAPFLTDYTLIEMEKTKHNPIAIKKGAFQILDQGRFYLSKTPEKKSKSWDSKHNRYCVWVKLQKKDFVFYVFNTHFDYHGKAARLESAKLMNTFIPSITQGKPYILAGDFNSVEGSNVYEVLMNIPRVQDARHAAQFSYVPKNSYNYFDPTKFSKWDLDHIFTDSIFSIYRYGVLNETYYDGETYRYPSDHSPILMIFKYPNSNTP